MKKPGFSLFELMIVIMAGSLMLTMLYNILAQSLRSYASLDTRTQLSRNIAVLNERFTLDVLGLTVPMHTKEADQQEKAEAAVPGASKPEAKEKKDTKVMPDYLELKSQGERTESFSFITNNPLAIYGIQTPQLVRVVYKVEPMQEGGYRLQRGQTTQLQGDEKITFYTIIENLTRITITLFNANKDKAAGDYTKQTAFKPSEQIIKPEESVVERPLVIELSGEITDDVRQVTLPILIRVPVYTHASHVLPYIPQQTTIKQNDQSAPQGREQVLGASQPQQAAHTAALQPQGAML